MDKEKEFHFTHNKAIQYHEDCYLSLNDITEALINIGQEKFKLGLLITSGASAEEIKECARRLCGNYPSDSLFMAANLLSVFNKLSKRKDITNDGVCK